MKGGANDTLHKTKDPRGFQSGTSKLQILTKMRKGWNAKEFLQSGQKIWPSDTLISLLSVMGEFVHPG